MPCSLNRKNFKVNPPTWFWSNRTKRPPSRLEKPLLHWLHYFLRKIWAVFAQLLSTFLSSAHSVSCCSVESWCGKICHSLSFNWTKTIFLVVSCSGKRWAQDWAGNSEAPQFTLALPHFWEAAAQRKTGRECSNIPRTTRATVSNKNGSFLN